MKELQMTPERHSKYLLSLTRAKAKMYEYSVDQDFHINISGYNPAKLYSLTISLIGDLSYYIISNNLVKINEIKKDLQFSAQFFDAFLQSNLDNDNSDYLKLIGASAYYLCDLPGSASVLLKSLNYATLDLDCNNIDKTLYSILNHELNEFTEDSIYNEKLNTIISKYQSFFITGEEDNLFDILNELRTQVYQMGNDRELLFIDILFSIIITKHRNSSWIALPKYSEISKELWFTTINKTDFIKELWPAQHLLGQNNIYKGQSAVIQMPTSAGKTKSTELIIRSAFLAERVNLAVIIAPFRALCNEIKENMIDVFKDENININQLTDILQIDGTDILQNILQDIEKTIIVLTPEKLYFILKHFPELANHIGLLIYDEGHQFDTGSRGVTYELLLTNLKQLITNPIQTILISAVIGNAAEINSWLNYEHGQVIEGTGLTPTYRTIGFASWLDTLGQVKFVTPENPDNEEYFVPRIIESHELTLRGQEHTRRYFPKKDDASSVALFLGLKLVDKGSVAIFSGTKTSVISMCNTISDAFDRNLQLPKPISISNEIEIRKISTLYQLHFGESNTQSKTVQLGILTHHANLPQGIKLSVEYALQNSLAKFVICTSTLAQGVNLPIRYLLVTSMYQAGDRLPIRDFHNLIGRAGRSGKYTEGSIIFTNPQLYDQRKNIRRATGGSGKWKWENTKELLNPLNSENSNSSILQIFQNIETTAHSISINVERLLGLLNNPDIDEVTDLDTQKEIYKKKEVLNAIESYILMNMEDINIQNLVQNTLAYYSADESIKEMLIELFEKIKENILVKIPEGKIKIYSKTLSGIDEILEIESWLTDNYSSLLTIDNTEDLLSYLWSLLHSKFKNNTVKKLRPNIHLFTILIEWIKGKSFYSILNMLPHNELKVGQRKLSLEHIIDICEKGFSFDLTLFLSTIIVLIEDKEDSEEKHQLIKTLMFLQKQIKYGLNSSNQIAIYELGFSDRLIAQEISDTLNIDENTYFREIKKRFHDSDIQNNISYLLDNYPSYFSKVYQQLLTDL